MSYDNLPENFQSLIEKASYEAPNIDIENDVREYVDGVVNNPSEEQEHLVKQFIKNKVTLSLHDWKSKYRQNDEIIENMEKHVLNNDKKIENLEKEKKDLQLKIKKINSSKHENEQYIQEYEKVAPTGDINKKFTLIFLITVAVGLAILTAYKFATAMSAIDIATSGESDISITKYILYGLGALAILATGKIINVIYEKIGYNKKFFLTVASLAIILSFVSAYYLASDKAFLKTKTEVTKDINTLKTDIKALEEDLEIEPGETLDDTDIKNQKILEELKVKKKQLEEKEKGMKTEAIELDQAMLILILFTEMLIGGTAWMYATDYTRYLDSDKRSHSLQAIRNHIDSSEDNAQQLLVKIEDLEDQIKKIRLESHDLHIIIADIKTEQEIDEIIDLIVEDETNKALSYLWKKTS